MTGKPKLKITQWMLTAPDGDFLGIISRNLSYSETYYRAWYREQSAEFATLEEAVAYLLKEAEARA